jgi:hypothetical protein
MEWIEQMKEAMRAISDACYKNHNLNDCDLCPFNLYCDAIKDMGYGIPEAWDTVNFKEH